MKSVAYRSILLSVLMITSSLAGCLGDEAEDADDSEQIVDPITVFGSVMVSTYHVGELVKAVAGEHVEMHYMSQDNIPVHDYEPSAADLIRLQEADVFFYHGLNLEPWVDSALESLGADAPASFMTHTMMDGEVTLDFESLLVSNLCELMNDGPFESTTLATMSDDHDDHDDHGDDDHGDDDHDDDDHGDDDHDDDGGMQTRTGHGDHSEDDDDHEDHDDHDDHGDDDHDDHEGHGHAEAEKVIQNPEECPADTTIQVFHMEAGEHILEFESEHGEDFNMAALKMLGGHAHHDHHGHGDGPFEWAGIFSISDVSHTWTMEKVDGSYADPSMRVVIIPTDTPTEETMHSLEDGVEDLIEGDTCTIVEDGESMTPVDGGSCFEWHVGTGDISAFTIDTSGMTGFAAYTAHSPYEFESTQHYLKDSAGNDVEHVAEEGGGGHGDHSDHGDDHSDDEDDHGDEMCHNTDTHENYESTEEDCEAAGHTWMADEDHGDHGEGLCHNTDTHENYESTEEDCEAAGHMWTGHEDHHDLPEIHADRVTHTLSFPIHIAGDWVDEWGAEHSIDSDSWNDNTITHYDNHEMWAVAQNSEDDAFSPGLWSKYDWTWQSEELYYCQSTFGADTEADALSAESANASDLEAGCGGFPWSLMEEAGHDDHHDMVCYDMNTHTVDSTITTEEDCDAAGLMWTAANSGPDDDDHGDDDHSDEEGDHDDHGDEDHGDEDHHEIGAVIIHIEEEGDYGFAMPSDIEFYVIMGEGGHDDHDDHGDEHDDHSDEEGDHDDHGDEIEADEGEEAFDYDPHSWLDPLSFNEQLKLVQDKLTMTFPDGTEAFAENTEAYSAQLTQLHDRFEVALGDQGTCVTGGFDKTIVANHNAYSYISVRYDIDILTVHGLDPEGEPSPAEVAEVVEHIKEEGITVLFVEEYTDQSAVQSIVEETGVEVQILYTMEMRPSDNTDDYLSMMNKNIVNIVTGIGC